MLGRRKERSGRCLTGVTVVLVLVESGRVFWSFEGHECCHKSSTKRASLNVRQEVVSPSRQTHIQEHGPGGSSLTSKIDHEWMLFTMFSSCGAGEKTKPHLFLFHIILNPFVGFTFKLL